MLVSTRMMDAGKMIEASAVGNALASTCVTFGVTWGNQEGYASASSSSPTMVEAKPKTSISKTRFPRLGRPATRTAIVEIISSQARRMAPKPLKKMVAEAVICEPVSDSTTGINRANSRIRALFVIAQDKITLCRRRFC